MRSNARIVWEGSHRDSRSMSINMYMYVARGVYDKKDHDYPFLEYLLIYMISLYLGLLCFTNTHSRVFKYTALASWLLAEIIRGDQLTRELPFSLCQTQPGGA